MTIQLDETQVQKQTQEEEVASFLHGVIAMRLGSYLFNYVQPKKLGYICGADADFAIPGAGTKRPNVAFVPLEKMPEPIDEEVPFGPALAAEVISRTDDWSAIVAKA